MQATAPAQLRDAHLSVIDAALNSGDSEAEARQRFARVADDLEQVEAMLLSWRFWRSCASR